MAEVTGTVADTTTVATEVVGNVAAGAADSGNPVKVGTLFESPQATVTSGQRSNLHSDNHGNLQVVNVKYGSSGTPITANQSQDANDGTTAFASSMLAQIDGVPRFSPLRTPTTFKTVSATALGTTALWTPAAGKKFRLMRYIIEVTENSSLAAGAIEIISMLDSAADIAQTHSVFIPTTAVTTGINSFSTGWIDLGNGVLSAAANNVLNVNLGTALATGAVRVTCCGTEE